MKQLSDLQKTKPSSKADETHLANLARLDAEYAYAKDDLDATQLRLRGLKAELKAVSGDIKKMRPDLEAKAEAASAVEIKIEALQATVDKAEEGVFGAFCKKIKVGSIREYEDVQLKVAQEEGEALEKFSQSKVRLGHQYVHVPGVWTGLTSQNRVRKAATGQYPRAAANPSSDS
jgi:structural maintenance of chromosome 1